MTPPLQMTVRIRNRLGLHARASAKFCAVAGSFDALVKVKTAEGTVSGTSIMGLMMLGAGQGDDIMILAEGPQAEEALDTLVKLVADRFGEGE
jgi:phosphocarrier protein